MRAAKLSLVQNSKYHLLREAGDFDRLDFIARKHFGGIAGIPDIDAEWPQPECSLGGAASALRPSSERLLVAATAEVHSMLQRLGHAISHRFVVEVKIVLLGVRTFDYQREGWRIHLDASFRVTGFGGL